jgi:glycosyltransferase involved in cell wall biosynthesis
MPTAGDVAGLEVGLVLGTSTGGTARHVGVLVGGLTRRGAIVTVMGPAATNDAFAFTAAGAAFAPLDMTERPRPGHDLAAVVRLRRLLRDMDVVHAHGLRAGGLCGLALTGRHRPALVVTVHNAVIGTGLVRAAYEVLERIVARRAAVVLCVSPDLVERARDRSASSVDLAVVPAPAPVPEGRDRAAVRAGLGVDDRPLVVGAGRLFGQKGFDTLLTASARWGRRTPPPLVVIAGTGPLQAHLAGRIEAEHLPVRLLGHREDVADLLGAADVLVVSSVWEGQPMIVQEMLRAGRPLVATEVGGIPRLVGDSAVLVPPDEPRALADAVERLLDDPAAAGLLAASARARADALPTEADAVDQVTTVYARLARPGRHPS